MKPRSVHVGDQLVGELAVVQDRRRRACATSRGAPRRPTSAPSIAGCAGRARLIQSSSPHSYVDSKTTDAVSGGTSVCEGHRVGLLAPLAVGAEDVELVAGARADVRDEQLPDAGRAELAHRVLAAVPVVEVRLDPHPARDGRPDRERGAGHVAERLVVVDVRAEHLPQLLVPALVDQVQVDLAEGGQEAVGVVDHVRVAVVGHRDPVVGHAPSRRQHAAHTPACSWLERDLARRRADGRRWRPAA